MKTKRKQFWMKPVLPAAITKQARIGVHQYFHFDEKRTKKEKNGERDRKREREKCSLFERLWLAMEMCGRNLQKNKITLPKKMMINKLPSKCHQFISWFPIPWETDCTSGTHVSHESINSLCRLEIAAARSTQSTWKIENSSPQRVHFFDSYTFCRFGNSIWFFLVLGPGQLAWIGGAFQRGG